MKQSGISAIAGEFDGVSLGDARLGERLRRIVELSAAAPDDSFPEQMQTVADREALYRFFSNPKVTIDGLLEGHVRQTHERLRGHPVIRVVHDTTTFHFSGEREGLGLTRGGASGFLGHFAVAVAAAEEREALGVLGVRPYIHQDAAAHRGMTPSQRVAASRAKSRQQKESSRWEKLAGDVSDALPDGVRAIHIMDQEADDYDLLAEMHRMGLGFVVRADPKRRTLNDGLCAKELLASKPAKLFRNVHVNSRSAKKAVVTRGRHPARSERDAALRIRWSRITIGARQHSTSEIPELSFWAVHVFEPKPPKGEEPIEWMLFTSEPVNTLAEATAVVDHYRARWVIEEYFKALKTGCAFERRQLTSFDGLTRALGVFVPIAWRLLVLRTLGRAPSPKPAKHVLDDEQLLLLRTLLETRRFPLPSPATVRDVMLGIAALGGHIRNNGDPGWLVLGRGFTRFVEAEEIWRLARRCDQS